MEYPSTEFFSLMTDGENICFITAPFGELSKSQREYKLLSTERVIVWFTIKTFIVLMDLILNYFCHFIDALRL